MSLLQRFIEQVQQQHLFSAKDKLLLTVSGGVDSVVLCGLCKQAGFDFVIAHCNFKLRGTESDRDEQFVKELAAKYNTTFFVKSFDTPALAATQKKSIEEIARDLRYEWFNELLEKEQLDWIVTAHHADDNIETMVMQFFRGTGIKGLRGMQAKNGKIVRPLLFARKKELEDFSMDEKLPFVTDHTNLENDHTRNYFRNQLIPSIRAVYPVVEQNLLNNLERFAETEELYDQAVGLHKKQLMERKGNEIHVPVLKLKKTNPLKSIVFEISREFDFSPKQVPEIIDLLDSESGKYVASSSHRIIRNRAWLIISPLVTEESATILIERGTKETRFPLGILRMEETNQHPASRIQHPASSIQHPELLDIKTISFPLILRPWKTGDYFYPLGMKKKKKVARFLIDLKLSKTDKEKVWVLESNSRILWVVGYRIDERFRITDATRNMLTLRVT